MVKIETLSHARKIYFSACPKFSIKNLWTFLKSIFTNLLKSSPTSFIFCKVNCICILTILIDGSFKILSSANYCPSLIQAQPFIQPLAQMGCYGTRLLFDDDFYLARSLSCVQDVDQLPKLENGARTVKRRDQFFQLFF